jgi:hypothetical protein
VIASATLFPLAVNVEQLPNARGVDRQTNVMFHPRFRLTVLQPALCRHQVVALLALHSPVAPLVQPKVVVVGANPRKAAILAMIRTLAKAAIVTITKAVRVPAHRHHQATLHPRPLRQQSV